MGAISKILLVANTLTVGAAKKFKYYHITGRDLGVTCELEPRVPAEPNPEACEDSTTPRICFSASIDGCISALGLGYVDLVNVHSEISVLYGTDTLNGFYDPTTGKGTKPKSTKNDKYKYQARDSAETEEVWATKPTKVNRVGVLKLDDSGSYRIYAFGTAQATKLLDKLNKHFIAKPKKKSKLWESLPKLSGGLLTMDSNLRKIVKTLPVSDGATKKKLAVYRGSILVLGIKEDYTTEVLTCTIDRKSLTEKQSDLFFDLADSVDDTAAMTVSSRIEWLRKNLPMLLTAH